MSPPNLHGQIIKAVVFDLDGTLINTTVDFRRMRQRAFQELASRGMSPSDIDQAATIVVNVERAAAFLRSQGRPQEVDDMRQAVGRLMDLTEMERVGETTAVDGAKDCITSLRSAGYRIGILTRGSRAYATAALHHAGLEGAAEAMICRDDHPEEEAKPNGVAMKRMAALLDTAPERCLLVGDHFMDLSCARSASAQFLGVLTGSFKQEDWKKHGAPEMIESVSSLPALLGIGKA